uniref:Uncharacterized protein n=1 Tax=Arundo donax TaxID=35708 RepID=A0A0A9HIJ4_ARUDO
MLLYCSSAIAFQRCQSSDSRYANHINEFITFRSCVSIRKNLHVANRYTTS